MNCLWQLMVHFSYGGNLFIAMENFPNLVSVQKHKFIYLIQVFNLLNKFNNEYIYGMNQN